MVLMEHYRKFQILEIYFYLHIIIVLCFKCTILLKTPLMIRGIKINTEIRYGILLCPLLPLHVSIDSLFWYYTILTTALTVHFQKERP